MRLEEVSRDPLTNRVIRQIKDLIWRGEVTPGEYLLPQPQLAAQLGVGLSTVREAVRALSLIGLLEPLPGRGTLVMPDAMKILSSDAAMRANLPPVELNEVLEARQVLESALARMAAERATPGDVAEIQLCLDEMERAAADDRAFSRADMRFHLAVARASRNQVLAQSYFLIHGLLEEAIQRADALPGGIERALVNHRDMLTGIRNRQPDEAQRASERQIMDVAEYFRQRELQGK
jgi:GntR family transcriptional regulator, transcriptional repressor for pyruvate dehydrogenase complex